MKPDTLPLGRRLVRRVLQIVARALFRVRVDGDTSKFLNERTLIVANHESLIDGLLLAVFLPVQATFVVHTTVARNPLNAWMLRFIPHLLVDSTSPLAMKIICKLVETGTPVVIFPEGRLTVTGSLMKVYDGAAFIAAKNRRYGRANPHRRRRPQLLRALGWNISTQASPENHNYRVAAAQDRDARPAFVQAETSPRG